jgi:hypothetical protein
MVRKKQQWRSRVMEGHGWEKTALVAMGSWRVMDGTNQTTILGWVCKFGFPRSPKIPNRKKKKEREPDPSTLRSNLRRLWTTHAFMDNEVMGSHGGHGGHQ